MGIRGELFSTRVSCEGRTYFFNVKENRMGDMFLTVVESKPTEADNFDRRSIVIFRDDVPEFLKALQGALGYMEKPGAAPPSIHYSSPSPPPSKRGRTPSGFAGAEDEAKAEAPKKRKIVVKRKSSPSSEASTPDSAASS